MGLAKTAVSVALLLLVALALLLSVDLSQLTYRARFLSGTTITIVLAALLCNALAAALRFKVIASDLGHPISFGQSLAAVSAGSVGGAAFFQLAGQLMARGVVMGRSGITFATVAVMTLYERFVAALISALLALAGAYYIFGQVYLDQQTGGVELIKICAGLFAAASAGALAGYGRVAAKAIAPVMNQRFALRMLRAVALSLLVQLPMMVGYIAAAQALSPHTPISSIAAASAIVMFAASVPISLAGWGVREMSAVIALGAIGVPIADAVIAALLVGIGSMLMMLILAGLSLPVWVRAQPRPGIASVAPLDYGKALAWSLPLGAATLVLFQLYLPVTSGTLLNVNLADPLAILGGSLFVLEAFRRGQLPSWRFGPLNAAVAVATLALSVSLLIGVAEFGWTQWAWLNRYLGWFVLLAFAATGALIVKEAGQAGLHILALTYAAAAAAVVGVDMIIVAGKTFSIELNLYINPWAIQGYAQNRNFLAFQILMALAAVLVAETRPALRTALLSVLSAGLFMTGSRSGWIAGAALLAGGLYTRAATPRELAVSALIAVNLVILAIVPALYWTVPAYFLGDLGGHPTQGDFAALIASTIPPVPRGVGIPAPETNAERLLTMWGGLKLFLENPIIGAGLGAYRNQGILATSGIPLVIHSTALWLMAEIGIVGLLAFAVPALRLLYTEIKRQHRDSAANLLVLCLLAFAVMSAPADMLYQRTFWLLIGAALAVPKPGAVDVPTGPVTVSA